MIDTTMECTFLSCIIIYAINRKQNQHENNVRKCLDIITGKYLKRIEIQFNYIKNKMNELNSNKNESDEEEEICEK